MITRLASTCGHKENRATNIGETPEHSSGAFFGVLLFGGEMLAGRAAAGFFGPTAEGFILTTTGAYTIAFFVAGMLSVVGIVLALIYQHFQHSALEFSKKFDKSEVVKMAKSR